MNALGFRPSIVGAVAVVGSMAVACGGSQGNAAAEAESGAPAQLLIEPGAIESPEYAREVSGRVGGPLEDPDGDGIPNVVDACPSDAEIYNSTHDMDGCPATVCRVTFHGELEPGGDEDSDCVTNEGDACPYQGRTWTGRINLDGCPEPVNVVLLPHLEGDADWDGIADHLDSCPEVPERYNTFDDFDGCPDLSCVHEPSDEHPLGVGCVDRDCDGFPERVDACPDLPESVNGINDDDGCPESVEELREALEPLRRELVEIRDSLQGDERQRFVEELEAWRVRLRR